MIIREQSVDAHEARQRRIELRRTCTKRTMENKNDDHDDDDPEDELEPDESISSDGEDSSTAAPPLSKKCKVKLSEIRGIKKQSRYEPGIRMSKEELARWRKEARRVRNRESAAASRQKTRARIEELEEQVNELQDKYDNALRQIAELEAQQQRVQNIDTKDNLHESINVIDAMSSKDDEAVVVPYQVTPPLSPRQDCTMLQNATVWSLPHQEAAQALAESLNYTMEHPTSPLSSPHCQQSNQLPQLQQQKQSPIMISRPTAV